MHERTIDSAFPGRDMPVRWSDRHANSCGFCAAFARWLQRRRNARVMDEPSGLAREALMVGGFGFVGRVLYWANNPGRPPLGWSLLWQVPIAFGMGVLGMGAADYFSLGWWPAAAVITMAAFGGPKLLEHALVMVERRLEKL